MNEDIKLQISQLEEQRDDIIKCIKETKGLLTTACPRCKESRTIDSLILIKNYIYKEPYGCSEGDYWVQNQYQYVCPNCSSVILIGILNNNDWLKDYESNFAEIVSLHEKGGGSLIDKADWPKFKALWAKLYDQDISRWESHIFTS